MQKRAIEIQSGDYLTPAGAGGLQSLDRAPTYGEVGNCTVVDAGVQISFRDGGSIVRAEDDVIEVASTVKK